MTGPAAQEPRGEAALRRLRHELRTPINHILGYGELLLEEAEDHGRPEQLADLRRIAAAGQQLLAAVADVLEGLRPDGACRVDPATAAVELRTHLTAIIGYSELLREEAAQGGPADEWLLADVARVHGAGIHLLSLLDAVLLDLALVGPALVDPALDPATGDAARGAAPGSPVASAPVASAPLSVASGTLLLADDDAQNREVLARRLERVGYRVAEAVDGRQALAMLREGSFDLLLLDVVMPEMDGLAVLRELKADPLLRELPVLVLSADDALEDAVACIRLGAEDYLAKPANPVLLLARIGACLERKRLRDRELAYLRQTAQVTGPSAIAQLLLRFRRRPEDDQADPERAQAEGALLADLDRLAEWVSLPKGGVLMHEGEPSDCLYVLLDGRLQVVGAGQAGARQAGARQADARQADARQADARQAGARTLLAQVLPGDSVGEWGLVTGEPRSATVVASRDARLARVSRDDFQWLADRHPRALTRTDRDVIRRLRSASHAQALSQSATGIALVPASQGAPVGDLAGRLAEPLSAYGPTLHLSQKRLAALLGDSAAADPHLGARLSDLERAYRYVLYEADEPGSAWTERCLRQADRVLLVGAAGRPALPWAAGAGRLEGSLLVGMRREVVLLNEGAPCSGTGAWLSGLGPLDGHHHTCLATPADVQRLARRLAGRAVGLVLGGGGLRGAAHVGAIKALREAGVPIDLVGGTSAGALVAAQVAAGWDVQQLQDTNRRLLLRQKPFRDYTVPLVSLLSGRRYVRVLRAMFGDTCIEDLALPYFAVAANLTRAEVEVLRTGSLSRAIRASGSVPGVFPPVQNARGDLLVDGGLLDNLPVDVMACWCGGGPVVAIDLRVKVDISSAYALGDSLSGMELLLQRANPFTPARAAAPDIGSVLMRASLLASVQAGAAQAQRSTLYVNPPVGHFPLLDGRAAEAMMEIGYQTTRERLAEWLATGPL